MMIPHHLRRGLIASLLLCTALSSVALTLGRSRGVALIGRALDVSVPVTLDSPGQTADLCAEADVFHGDNRVVASNVTTVVTAASGQNAMVRVRSSLPVDEPVVTLYLRLGCNQKITRRYVLLAEEPGEVQPTAAPLAPRAAVVTQLMPAQAAQTTPLVAAAETASRSRRATPSAAMPARGAAVGKSERALAQAQPGGPSAPRAASRTGRPRLTVDMLDLAPEGAPQLRATQDLAGAPSTSDQVRAQAAALWRSINAQPEDVLRDMQRVQALETDMKGLRTLVADNDRTLVDLREQLKQARQERNLILAAIALLLLLLAAMVVTWWLRRGERVGSRDWWRRRDAAVGAAVGNDAPRGPTAGPLPPARAAEMDLRVDESMFESLKTAHGQPQVATATAPPAETHGSAGVGATAIQEGFYASQVASMRMVRAEELVDIQQQADFFMSLGQTDQAIEVLESHIRDNAETSALVWLDLLAIYRALKRRADYESLRGDFQRVFNADVPGYDSTPTSSGGLEDYPRALSRIAALWPSPKVMGVIEESIFRKPGTSEGEPFDLEAYRELVMLYNLGREVVQGDPVPGEARVQAEASFNYSDTAMQPLSQTRNTTDRDKHEDDVGRDVRQDRELSRILDSMLSDGDSPGTIVDDLHDPQVPRPSPRLGLDIDLSDTDRAPSSHSASVDFELSEPGDGGQAR